MTDESLDAILGRLEGSARPEQAFADSLFDKLAVDAGLRDRGRSGRGIGRWAGVMPATTQRLAWVAVLAALLVAMAGYVFAGPGRQSPPRPSPFALIEQPPSPPPTLHLGSGLLSVGSRAPVWTGTLLDGGTFSTSDLLGRPAALFMWCSCLPGPQARLFADSASKRGEDIGFVLVSVDLEGTTRGLVEELGTDLPVVEDQQMGLLGAWDLKGFPALVLLRADGTVADIQQATFGDAKLAALLDALAGAQPIPDPEVRTPTPTDSAGQLPLTTVLEVGAPAPVLSGPMLGGGEGSTKDLLGHPAIVHFWLPPRRDGAPLDDMPQPDALMDVVRDRGDEVALLLVVSAEAEVGDARRYLDRQGWDGDVLLDWSGELSERWGLIFGQSSVVLDAGGRVLRVAGPESEPAALVDAAGSPGPP